MKFTKTLLAAGILAAMAVVPAMAEEVIVSGNGNNSNNTAIVKDESSTTVLQGNATVVVTIAEVKSDTGDNSANNNTTGSNGDPTINTGDATSKLKVDVAGGTNTATLPEPCGCPDDDIVKIKDNGNGSTNKVVVKDDSTTLVGQGNLTGVLTLAKVKSDSGDNKANNNTGSGNVKIKTGNAKSKLKVKVTGSSNTLNP